MLTMAEFFNRTNDECIKVPEHFENEESKKTYRRYYIKGYLYVSQDKTHSCIRFLDMGCDPSTCGYLDGVRDALCAKRAEEKKEEQ